MTSSQQFNHPYLPQTESQIQLMLEKIDVPSIDGLFSGIPKNLRFYKEINLPKSHSEQESIARIRKVLSKNIPTNEIRSFLGAGIYHHFIPTVVSTILNRSEFYTAYTPYAPEVSQGMLQSLWEYQSMIAEITKLDLANSSMYDMSTALGEAALMCTRITKKNVFIVPDYLQPERFATLKTYAQGPNINVKTFTFSREKGTVDLGSLKELINSHKNNISGIYIENPNFWGVIEDQIAEVGNLAHNSEALFVVGIDPISLGILKAPGDYGADIAIGEGQSLGLPMNFGGPLLGIFAVKNDRNFSRAMPGRIIGLTTEKKSSRRAFTMTLQTREQHIRREKATSNICTNNALCALASNVYLSLIGPNGLKKVAETCMARTAYLMEKLDSIKEIKSPYFSGISFREFVFKLNSHYSTKKFESFLLKNNIIPGLSLESLFPNLEHCYLSTSTEMTELIDIDYFATKINEFITKKGDY